MTFKEAIKILDIEDYGERIFNSNSHGELSHLADYIYIAQMFPDSKEFRGWFISVVEWAEERWERPESIFQHILEALEQAMKA